MHADPHDLFEAALLRWEAAGLISSNQRAAITKFEAAQTVVSSPTEDPREGLSVLAELGIYLGIVVVVVSGAFATSLLWQDLGTIGRAAIGLIIVALSVSTAQMLRKESGDSLIRLRHFLHLCGSAGAALSTAVIADATNGHRATSTVILAGLVLAGVNGWQWRNRDRTLALFGTVTGLAMMVVGSVAALNWTLPNLVTGLLFVTLGGISLLAAHLVLNPRLAISLLSQLALFVGAIVVVSGYELFGFALGLVAAGGGVALGLRTKATPVTAVGLVSFIFFTIWLLTTFIRGPLAIFLTFFIGVGVVVVVLRKGLATKTRQPNS